MKLSVVLLSLTGLPLLAFACSSEPDPGIDPEPECEANADCGGDTPYCEPEELVCAAAPVGGLIGWGDGSVGSVKMRAVMENLTEPTDLAFHPDRPELWVINRDDDSVVVVTDFGGEAQAVQRMKDPAAMHFMDRPPAIAMGADNTWATCGDSDNGGDDFMGPALFSADLSIFAVSTPFGLGSHLDMLHSTTFCRGIAHETANIYWVFNSNKGSLDRYDFKVDHGPGNDDHSDGEIYRYVEGQVAGVDGTSSHLAYHGGLLYIADTGNQRIARLDPSTATMGSAFFGDEPTLRRNMDGAELVDVVPPGTLEAPSGLEIIDDVLYVTDAAQSRLYAFDLEGALIRTLDTDLPAGSLGGMAVGPDGMLYVTDVAGSRVFRVEPR